MTVIAPRRDFAGKVEPFAILPDGQWLGAKITPAEEREPAPHGRAVVLGFYLADIKRTEARQAVLKEALSFLRRTAQPPARVMVTETESKPARREETPTGTSSGESDRK